MTSVAVAFLSNNDHRVVRGRIICASGYVDGGMVIVLIKPPKVNLLHVEAGSVCTFIYMSQLLSAAMGYLMVVCSERNNMPRIL